MIADVATSDWRAENATWLALSLEQLRLRLSRRALWLNRPLTAGLRAADWLVTGPDDELERRFFRENAAAVSIDALLAKADAQLAAHEAHMRQTSRAPALRALSELIGLSRFEENVLQLAAAPGIDGAFGRAYAELHDDPGRPFATLHLALGTFVDDATDRVLAADSLMPTRPLRALRLIDAGDGEDGPGIMRPLAVDERLSDFLRGLNRTDARIAPFLSDVGPALWSGQIELAAERVAALFAAEPERWVTVNLVGTVARGARDIAERACARLGIALRTVDVSRLAAVQPERLDATLVLLGREALLSGFALLVDAEAIEPRSAAAVVVKEMIGRLAANLFVVSEQRWPGEHDLRVVDVPALSRTDQQALWRRALEGRAHNVNGEIESIVQQFDMGPVAIAGAVSDAGQRSGGTISGDDLWQSCRRRGGGNGLDELADRIVPCYGWDDIVVSDDVCAQLRELVGQVNQRGRVYETWGFGASLGHSRGITALFAGPSGTGKTMAAQVISDSLRLDLYRIDLARVVSKYIGETEKNLRRVFDAAERSGAILFFDEADALFGTRTEVRDSHDRYANVEINYLLQRMENYAGLAILATNRRGALDGAFLRRLRFIIEFPFPSPSDRRRIWEQVFPQQAEIDGLEHAFLSRLELTGGNIRSIAVNAAFLAASERSPIGMPHVMRAAAREYTKLARPVGATEFGPYHAMVRA